MTNAVAVQQNQNRHALSTRMSDKYGVEPARLMDTLKKTAFKQNGKEISNEQLCALMIVADKYDLNPFVKEIYAFPDRSGGIVPIVGVDGWNHIMNAHPNFDGVEFEYSEEETEIATGAKMCPEWIEARIYVKGRTRPVAVREYLDECYQDKAGPWKSHTKRMLRHKALIQAARIAFGFAGIYEEDEAERIVQNEPAPLAQPEINQTSTADDVKTAAASRRRRKPKDEPEPESKPQPEEIPEAEVVEPEPEPEPPEPEQQPEQEPQTLAEPETDQDLDLF